MNFFAVNGKRPVRLSEDTRRFAWESLNYKYGRQTKENPCVHMDAWPGFETMTELEKYDAMIAEIVKEAPVRICPGEKVSGAATLGDAIRHLVPARFQNERVIESVSHLTIDFETVLKEGVDSIRMKATEAYERYRGTDKEPFAASCLKALEGLKVWHQRYLSALKEMPGYEANYENLLRVPFKSAVHFYDAVQSIWFVFAFVRQCGNWPGIGRIDWLLGPYLKKDLEEGILTLEEAREILAHFFIKGCEWVAGGDYGSGDAQHYQNLILSGVDENGQDVTNEVTYLVLDVIEELGISDFPITVRINRKTDREFLKRVSEVIRLGGGVIAVYNEDLILDSLVKYGYEPGEARKFANDGCWEVQIPGKTYFAYAPFDSYHLLQEAVLENYGNVSYDRFEDLYQAYLEKLKLRLEQILEQRNAVFEVRKDGEAWRWKTGKPCTVVSLFEQGCVEKGLSYLEGGPVYNVLSPHIGGLPDTVNSLYAIKKLVFDEKKIEFAGFMELLRNNWEGDETFRQYVLNRYTYFGNDNDEVDAIAVRLVEDFAKFCDDLSKRSGFKMPGGISTFGRQIEWAPHRLAAPYGKKAHEILAGNFSPTPGTDREGATAIIKSYCKPDLGRMVSGAALDLKLLPASVNGEKGLDNVSALIQGFVLLGGHFMQLDIADTELLKMAREHPEDYPHLSVRVSGWNARFVTLNKEWQEMILAASGAGSM